MRQHVKMSDVSLETRVLLSLVTEDQFKKPTKQQKKADCGFWIRIALKSSDICVGVLFANPYPCLFETPDSFVFNQHTTKKVVNEKK